MIQPKILRDMWSLLCEHRPNEVCGALASTRLGQGQPCYDLLHLFTNYAPDPTKEFWMAPGELALFLDDHAGRSIMLWHSHPNSRWNLSPCDAHVMRKTRLPMAIVAVHPYPSVVVYDHQVTQTAHCILQVDRYQIPAEEAHVIR